MWPFRKTQREIFRYWDGLRWRAIDPMVVFRSMSSHPEFNPEVHIPLLASDNLELQQQAAPIAVAATRQIFGIEAFADGHEGGLTELETLAVLNDFCEFADGLKKNGNGQQTSPVAMEPECSGPSATKDKSDCGSTSAELSCADQPES